MEKSMKLKQALIAIGLIAGLTFSGSASASQVVVDETCAYNEAIAGQCTPDREMVIVEILPGDMLADWFTSYGGLDLGCKYLNFELTACVRVEFTSSDDASCIIYPTFTNCADNPQPPVQPAPSWLVVTDGSVDCVEASGTFTCTAVKNVPATAPVPSFTG